MYIFGINSLSFKNKHFFVISVTLFASTFLIAGDFPNISTTAIDPFETCTVLDKSIPRQISSIRHIGHIFSETVVSDADYCEVQAQECDISTLQFSGLTLELLVKKETQEASVLAATLSSPRWNIFGKIKIGQRIEVLEKYYGVSIPRDVSPVNLEGECTPLTIWHSHGRVTKLHLDCQACI